MAESEAKPITTSENVETKKLNYLDFVLAAALRVTLCLSTVYELAKHNSGPLKSGVHTVERTVTTLVGPVYDKFHHVSIDLLYFVDSKVDKFITEADRHMPSLIKQTSSQARAVASNVQRAGVVGTAKNITNIVCTRYEPTAKEYYAKYESLAEQYAVQTWTTVNRLPLVSQAAHILVPVAAYWSEKYNQAVAYSAEKGYTLSFYMPLIPLKKIAKVFEGAGNEPSVSTNGE